MLKPMTPRNLLLGCLISLTLLTQACQSANSTSNQSDRDQRSELSESSDRPESSQRNTPESSRLGNTQQNRPATSQDSTRTITKEVVVVANALNALPAELTSQSANSKINIRSKPTTQSRAKHFGYKGDRITLLKEAQTDSGHIWYFVEFNQSKAKGWVRGDFVFLLDNKDLEGTGDVIPIDYSGTYVSSIPQTDHVVAEMIFRQTGKSIQFTAIQQTEDCASEVAGEASFSPDANEFVGSTNDGRFQIILIPQFANGQPTGQFEVVTRDGRTQKRLTKTVEACSYDGIYQKI